jgi:hypothetical protein
MRDADDPLRPPVVAALEAGERIWLDLLYGDYEGGQRTIVRFNVVTVPDLDHRSVRVLRYWNVDGGNPRDAYNPT